MSERIYMSSPDVGELEEKAVLAAMRGGWIAPLGPDVDAFEHEMAERIGVKHAVALSSGTAALHLGLLTLGAKRGSIVVTSTMTFAATTNAIMYTGAEPYFIDCLPETGNMDPELLRKGLTRLRADGADVVAILPVDLLGKAIDYTSILAIADDFGIPVLSDAAESLGATHRGKPAGSFGKASVFSFNGNKIMTTSGGGMLMTDDADLAQHVRYLATQARQPVVHYEHNDVGYNYRLSNLLAALGRAQLSRLDSMIYSRRQLRIQYKDLFSTIEGIEVFGASDDDEDNVWLTAISVDATITGWSAIELSDSLAEHNIESRPLWKPMHLQPVFAEFRGEISGVSEKLFRTHITIPSGSALSESQRRFVVERISEFAEARV
ncbi:DegT/DnrJ/EryC1/StrS family aminotransferase [Glutamicibacter ardleyensis]|uniref:DegT/DnrJ/EryC1/StrS family aminotransferase n=1 Tax=Glutamicibacter ardleyensis TaxID=225894 RepID=UPI003FD454C8